MQQDLFQNIEPIEIVMVTGLNGFIFFTGISSVVHDQMIGLKSEGVKCEIIKANMDHKQAHEEPQNLIIYSNHNFNINKIATTDQWWSLTRYYVNNYKNPINPTPNITKECCA